MDPYPMTARMVDSKIRAARSETSLEIQRQLTTLTYQLLTVMILFSVLAVAVAVAILDGSA